MRNRLVLPVLSLLVLGVIPTGAQTYTFSACSSGVTFSATINSIISRTGPVSDGSGGRFFNYIFQGSYRMTNGALSQTSSGLGAIGIYFAATPALNGPLTTFGIEAPNADGTGGPGLGAAASRLSWGVRLQGPSDLLPSGLPQTLPPLASWSLFQSDYIFGDGKTLGFVDLYGACPVTSVSGGKLLGDPTGPGECLCGDPINIGNGNLFEMITDYQTSGQNPLAFVRYYNGRAGSIAIAATLGLNWRSNFDRHLRIVSPSSVIVERQSGRQLTFALAGNVWSTDTDVDLRLTNSGTTWTLTDHDDLVETYSTVSATQALMRTIRFRNGYTQTLQYNATNQLTSVTDSYGRRLGFTYNNGLLQTVATPDSLTLAYSYSTSAAGSRLTSVAYSTSPVTRQSYLYENAALPGAMTAVVDENGNRVSSWTYDSTGRALSSQQGAGAGLTRIAYNDTDGSRTVTYPLGEQKVFRFTTLQGVPKVTQIERLATASTPAAIIRLTYDSYGYMASQTDWNGNLTTYVNDARGRQIGVIEAAQTPLARTVALSYHPTLNLPQRIDEPGHTTTFTYDAAGNLLTETRTDTTTTTVPYSTNGSSRTWTYTWSNSFVSSVKRPRTDVAAVTRFTYDNTGALTAITNALGQTTRITEHLPGGLPQTIVDANGVTTRYTYDARLRPLTRTLLTAAGPLTTTYSYDAAGNPIGATLADGSTITKTYDAAHRLTGLTDLSNQTIAYTLDALGGRTQRSVVDASRKQQWTRATTFDPLGRVLQEISGAGRTMSYSYDANGNPLTVTDALGRVTTQSFDALNRLVRSTDPAGGVTAAALNTYGRPTTVTDPNGGTTSLVYDGFGDVIQRVSPDSGVTIYRYDANGNRTQSVDAAGAVTNYTYDALDRMTAVTYPGSEAENITYTYDQPDHGFGVGRVTTVVDAAGTLSRTYDERGNALSETRVNVAVTLRTAYTYDALNRVNAITYPSGWTIVYGRDAMGRITGVTAHSPDGGTTLPVVTNAAYQPFGPLTSLTFGNGVAEARSFDLDYRVTSLADAGMNAIQALTYSYDAANNISSLGDAVTAANNQTFGYDALNRLTSAAGAYGNLSYTYDGVGNRLSQGLDGSMTTYEYASGANRLLATKGGVDQTIGHTKTGHIESFNAASLTYNQAGRLAAVTAGSNQARYTYDGFGQRLIKAGAATTLYQYDRRRRLIEETDGEGHAQVDYIYLDDLPVATLSPSTGEIYFLHGDRLGTPQVATDGGQNVVWTASYGPFGEMSAIPSLIVQNLRMPGQEFDVDTGLYHNGFRDYVPAWGRYLQSDPMGLAAGLNTYAYAENNPILFKDPLGLIVYNLLDPSEPMYGDMQQLSWEQQSSLDRIVIVAHGNPWLIGSKPGGDIYYPVDLARMLQGKLGYKKGAPIEIIACSAGYGMHSFAQQVADLTGSPVRASTCTVTVTGPGAYDGCFVNFWPNQVRGDFVLGPPGPA